MAECFSSSRLVPHLRDFFPDLVRSTGTVVQNTAISAFIFSSSLKTADKNVMILVMCANVISIRLHAPAKVLRCLKISPLLILMWPSGRQVERNWLRNQGMSHGDYHDILISKVAKNIAKHIHFDGRIPTCFNRKSNEVHMGHIGKETNSKGKLPLQNKLQKSGITCAGREKSNHIWQQIKQQVCRCAHREIYTVSIYCLLLACLSNWKTVRLELFQFKTSPIPSRTKPLHTPKKHHPT